MSDVQEFEERLSKVERALFGKPDFSGASEAVAGSEPVSVSGLLALTDKLRVGLVRLEDAVDDLKKIRPR